jgi:hypothetical protein
MAPDRRLHFSVVVCGLRGGSMEMVFAKGERDAILKQVGSIKVKNDHRGEVVSE